MCLFPKSIPNPKSIYDLQGGQKAFLTIKCGHCEECLREKRNEWLFRSLAQCQSTFDQGGYLLSVTLTYNNENVPHISDFVDIDYVPTFIRTVSYDDFDKCIESDGSIDPSIDTYKRYEIHTEYKTKKTRVGNPHYDFMCFSRDDLRDFFKRLRRRLDYHGFDVKNNLKYLVTGEYGTKEGCTHRPHYHVLFYVTDRKISPVSLSYMIDGCWKFGMTDGIMSKGLPYLMKHCYGRGFTTDNAEVLKACTYVTKYITKDSAFEKKVDARLNVLFNRVLGYDWRSSNDENVKKVVRSVRRVCEQFHLQSQGFGEAYGSLKGSDGKSLNTIESIMETGVLRYFNSKSKIYGYLQVPMYYQRKLFYKQHENFNHRLVWDLTALGKEYKSLRESKAFELLTQKMIDWHLNMTNHDFYSTDTLWYDRILSDFNKTLGEDRTIEDFCEYLIAYKGRIKSVAQRDRELKGVYECDPMDGFMARQYADLSKEFCYQYPKSDFGVRFLSKKIYYPNEEYDKFEGVKFGMFNAYYVIDEHSDPKFRGFDHLWDLYCESQMPRAIARQRAFVEKENLQRRLKDKFNIGRVDNSFEEI